MEKEIPIIRRLAEIGDSPFQFIEKMESILQGWDAKIRKNIYLFKTDSGEWGYFDKETNQLIHVTQWKGDSAMIDDHYVKMAVYHRIKIEFMFPLEFTGWDSAAKKEIKCSTKVAIIVITDKTYKQINDQLNGRALSSFLKFIFVTRMIQNRKSTYVDNVVWVS